MVKNSLYNALITISGPLINLLSIPIATRALGVTAFGDASMTLSVIAYFSIVASLGLSVYGTRELARVKADSANRNRVFSELLFVSIAGCVVTSLGYAFVAIYFLHEPIERVCVGLLILLFAFLNIEWLYYAVEKFSSIAYRTIVSRLIALLFVYSFVHTPSDLLWYVVAMGLSNLLPSFIVFLNYQKHVRLTWTGLDLKRHLRSLFSFLSIRISSSIYATLDIALVGYLIGASTAGAYAIAIRVVRIVAGVVCSTTAVAMPRASVLIGRSDKKGYSELLVNVLIGSTILSTVTAIFVFLFSQEIVRFLSGPSYGDAIGVLKVLALIVPIVALSNFVGMQILYPNNREKTVATSLVIGSLFCVLAMPYFSTNYGLVGAGATILLVELFILIVQLIGLRGIIENIFADEISRMLRVLFVTLIMYSLAFIVGISVVPKGLGATIFWYALLLIAYGLGLLAIKEPLLQKALSKI